MVRSTAKEKPCLCIVLSGELSASGTILTAISMVSWHMSSRHGPFSDDKSRTSSLPCKVFNKLSSTVILPFPAVIFEPSSMPCHVMYFFEYISGGVSFCMILNLEQPMHPSGLSHSSGSRHNKFSRQFLLLWACPLSRRGSNHSAYYLF